jgi:hypothetical protein
MRAQKICSRRVRVGPVRTLTHRRSLHRASIVPRTPFPVRKAAEASHGVPGVRGIFRSGIKPGTLLVEQPRPIDAAAGHATPAHRWQHDLASAERDDITAPGWQQQFGVGAHRRDVGNAAIRHRIGSDRPPAAWRFGDWNSRAQRPAARRIDRRCDGAHADAVKRLVQRADRRHRVGWSRFPVLHGLIRRDAGIQFRAAGTPGDSSRAAVRRRARHWRYAACWWRAAAIGSGTRC